MSHQPRFFFDECVGLPVMERVGGFFSCMDRFRHILTHFASGELDEDWLPKLAKEGNWVVITGDRGKNSAQTAKLPLLCESYGVTHVMLGQSVHQLPSDDKARILVASWPLILGTASSDPGSKFLLMLNVNASRDGFSIRLGTRPPKSKQEAVTKSIPVDRRG